MNKLKLILALLAAFGVVYTVNAQSGNVEVKSFGFDAAAFPQVRAFVSVTDAQGKPIQTLRVENFLVEEDGARTDIIAINTSDEPIHVGLLIDHSSSMSGGKLEDAKRAADAFVSQMRAGDEAFVIQFDDTNEILTAFTTDQTILKQAIDSIQLRGGTAFYDATYVGVEKFAERKEVRKKTLLVLTDGADNREQAFGVLGGSRHSLDETIAKAKADGVTVYTIGLGNDADQEKLKRLAQETGGRAYFSPGGEELRDLYLLIAEQLQKDYALDFKSPRPAQDGTRRNVKITVTLPNGETHTVNSVYVAGYLFNRIRADWLIVGLLGLALFGMAFAPSAVRLFARPAAAPQPFAEPVPPPAPPPQVVTVTCQNCGTVNRATARFCGNCRHNLSQPAPRVAQPRPCPNCGNALREGAKFCGKCGYRLG